MSKPLGLNFTAGELQSNLAGLHASTPVTIMIDSEEYAVLHIDVTLTSVEIHPDISVDDYNNELEAIVTALAEGSARTALAERARAVLGYASKIKPSAA